MLDCPFLAHSSAGTKRREEQLNVILSDTKSYRGKMCVVGGGGRWGSGYRDLQGILCWKGRTVLKDGIEGMENEKMSFLCTDFMHIYFINWSHFSV